MIFSIVCKKINIVRTARNDGENLGEGLGRAVEGLGLGTPRAHAAAEAPGKATSLCRRRTESQKFRCPLPKVRETNGGRF